MLEEYYFQFIAHKIDCNFSEGEAENDLLLHFGKCVDKIALLFPSQSFSAKVWNLLLVLEIEEITSPNKKF